MEDLIKYTEKLQESFSSIRTDRATPALVENLLVDAYGQKLTVKELASISTPGPRQIMLQPWDREIITQLERALEHFNPKSDGNIIRVFLPALTNERKEELKKEINAKTEQIRILVRKERDQKRDEIKIIKDEDEKFRSLKELDEKVEKINNALEEMKNNKIKETCS